MLHNARWPACISKYIFICMHACMMHVHCLDWQQCLNSSISYKLTSFAGSHSCEQKNFSSSRFDWWRIATWILMLRSQNIICSFPVNCLVSSGKNRLSSVSRQHFKHRLATITRSQPCPISALYGIEQKVSTERTGRHHTLNAILCGPGP